MKQLDVYYRALLEYREQTQQNRECISDLGAAAKANADLDKIVLTRKHCIIEVVAVVAVIAMAVIVAVIAKKEATEIAVANPQMIR